jgi:predicted RND superfamily exporter protein
MNLVLAQKERRIEDLLEDFLKKEKELSKVLEIVKRVENKVNAYREEEIKKELEKEELPADWFRYYLTLLGDISEKLEEIKGNIYTYKDRIFKKVKTVDFSRPRYYEALVRLLSLVEDKIPEILDISTKLITEVQEKYARPKSELFVDDRSILSLDLKLKEEERTKLVKEELVKQKIEEILRRKLKRDLEKMKKKSDFFFRTDLLVNELKNKIEDFLISSEEVFAYG